MLQNIWLFLITYDNVWLWQSHHNGIFVHVYVSLVILNFFMNFRCCIIAVNDFSSDIMTASAGDDNSTKELKGFVVLCLKLLNDMILY